LECGLDEVLAVAVHRGIAPKHFTSSTPSRPEATARTTAPRSLAN
jgi:hypothetical protein